MTLMQRVSGFQLPLLACSHFPPALIVVANIGNIGKTGRPRANRL